MSYFECFSPEIHELVDFCPAFGDFCPAFGHFAQVWSEINVLKETRTFALLLNTFALLSDWTFALL